MTAILAKTDVSKPFQQVRDMWLLLCWEVSPEGLGNAARFAGVASLAAARIVCSIQDGQLALSLACWRDDGGQGAPVAPPSLSIPLLRCCTPDVHITVDDARALCHVDAPGVAAISFTFRRTDSALLEADALLYARTTVAERIGLLPVTLERAVLST
ncbi:MAG: hypothetical protein H7210_13265 [Pyrinomonadaceae bacterium]|nr:hypothetical protein [Phycisphaerales bacterium]